MNKTLQINLLAIIGAVLLLIIVLPYKLSFGPDSIIYLEVSKNIISGKGVVDNKGYLVNHWPPMYPIAIGFISNILKVGVIQAGLILQVILFYLFSLSGMLVCRELKLKQKLIPFFFLCLIFSQASINFLNFLSEALFLVLLLFSFYFIVKWLDTYRKIHLIVSAFICSLFFLTRYAGIAFIGCYILYIILFQKEKIGKRFRNVLIFSIIFLTGILPWFIYQIFFEKPPVGRKIAVHIIPLSKLIDFSITVAYWFFGSTTAIISFLILTFIIFYKWKTIWKQGVAFYRTNIEVVRLILLFLLLYPLFLVISISFFDAWTPMDNRMLSPLLVFVIILLFLFFQRMYERQEKLILVSGIAFLLLSFSSSMYPVLKNQYEGGRGYSKKEWVESKTIIYLKNNSLTSTVFSNGVELGKLHLQKDFQMLPRTNDISAINHLINKVCKGEAQIVYFNEVNWRNYLISDRELKEIFKKKDVLEFKDGFIIGKFTDQ